MDGECSGIGGAGDGLLGIVRGDVSVPVSEIVLVFLSGKVA